LVAVGHVQNQGDTFANEEGWVGRPGSGLAIEGYVIVEDIEVPRFGLSYQAVLRDGSLSKKFSVTEYCGTRGQNKPIYGLIMHLENAYTLAVKLTYEATFVDGSKIRPLPASVVCKAATQSALEAFRVTLSPS
jgi:hypothetical protein